jgi:hypothetical protein
VRASQSSLQDNKIPSNKCFGRVNCRHFKVFRGPHGLWCCAPGISHSCTQTRRLPYQLGRPLPTGLLTNRPSMPCIETSVLSHWSLPTPLAWWRSAFRPCTSWKYCINWHHTRSTQVNVKIKYMNNNWLNWQTTYPLKYQESACLQTSFQFNHGSIFKLRKIGENKIILGEKGGRG